MEKVTVEEFNALLVEIAKKEDEIEVQQEVISTMNKELMQLEAKGTRYLKELEQDEFSGPMGKAVIENKWRVNLPENDVEKAKLFDHLRERNLFDRYATVNSMSLNSLFMADWKEAQKKGEGMTFTMPGVPAPKLHEKFRFKRSKK